MILKQEPHTSVGYHLKKMTDMYKDIEKIMKTTNGNHFGFEGMQITEMAQYTEYPEGGFYDWHVDNDVNCANEPPVRKISMTILFHQKMN